MIDFPFFLSARKGSPIRTPFFDPTSDARTTYIVGALILGFILLLVISSILSKRRVGRSGKRKHKVRTVYGQSRFNRFRREALKIGLRDKQVQLLEALASRYHIRNPLALFEDSKQLEEVIKRGIRETAASKISMDAIEERTLELYRIRQHIDRYSSQFSLNITSTRSLMQGQHIVLVPDGGKKRLSARVLAKSMDAFKVAIPPPRGSHLPGSVSGRMWHKGESLTGYVYSYDGGEISFRTKVISYITAASQPRLLLKHSTRLVKKHRRRFLRKAMHSPCLVSPVIVISRNPQKDEKARIVKGGEVRGAILDISSGGASFSCLPTPAVGSLVKVEFEVKGGNRVVTFGKVVGQSNSPGGRQGTVTHVIFTRASTTSLNLINRFVYNF